jgi:hypothetical protein
MVAAATDVYTFANGEPAILIVTPGGEHPIGTAAAEMRQTCSGLYRRMMVEYTRDGKDNAATKRTMSVYEKFADFTGLSSNSQIHY